MSAVDFLSADDVTIDVAPADKSVLLRQLAIEAAARIGLDGELVSADVLKREALGSTGVGKGIAMPHARIDGLLRPAAAIARLRRAIDFDAIDGEPVDFVALLLLPGKQESGALNVLAALARKLRDEGVMRRVRAARTADELCAVLKAE